MHGLEIHVAEGAWPHRESGLYDGGLYDGDRAGLCRLGDALRELLALYPTSVEMEPAEVPEIWTAESYEFEPFEMATV